MNWSRRLGATVAVGWLAGCAGYESADAEVDAQVAPEAEAEQYRISVEIPVDDVTIATGQNLDVDALLDARTAFEAADFHLREVVLIARSRRGGSAQGGSAELIVDDWASGAVDIPEGDAESWYEVRIPAADVGDAGVEWEVDFAGALDLNLLVAVLEPRTSLLAQATATVREVTVVDEVAADATEAAIDDPVGEVVHAVEVVESAPAGQTVVKEVAVIEQPVYETKTVYRYVDRPVYHYRASWIYDPARYYVFRDYGGWTYRYFPGSWDWRYYDLSFRLPSHGHRHHDRRGHRADRHDGRRYERRDRDDRRGDRDRRRGEGDRDARDRGDRDRDRRGDRRQHGSSPAVVSRPTALGRRVDPSHPRARLASRIAAEPRDRDLVNRTGQRTIASRPNREEAANRRTADTSRPATVGDVRTRSFERGEARRPERRATSTRTSRRPVQRQPVSTPATTSEPRRDHSPNPRTRSFQRRFEQPTPRTASPRTVQPRRADPDGDPQPRANVRRSNPPVRSFQRETDRRTAVRTLPRPVEPRPTVESRRSTSANPGPRRSVDRERANARAFQRRSEPRVAEPSRPRTEPPRRQSRPRSSAPVRSTPPSRASSTPRPQRAAPSTTVPRAVPQRERPARRPPAKTNSDSGSDARSDEGSRSNNRRRAERR